MQHLTDGCGVRTLLSRTARQAEAGIQLIRVEFLRNLVEALIDLFRYPELGDQLIVRET
jgi:hypothetical protein